VSNALLESSLVGQNASVTGSFRVYNIGDTTSVRLP